MVHVSIVDASGAETVIAEQDKKGFEILSCKSTVGLDTVSSAEITLSATNKMRNLVKGKNPTVAIYENDRRVFIGSVASPITEDIFGNVKITLDGALSWLADICKAPFRVESSENMSVSTYLTRIINQYNEGARADRQIALGGVTVDGIVAVVHSDQYTPTLDLVREIRETFGGYLLEICGREGDKPRIDYIAEPTIKNPHPLLFGVNLKTLDETVTFDGYASRVCATTRDGLTYTATDSDAEQVWGRVDYPLSSDAENATDLQAEAEAELAARSTPLQNIEAQSADADAQYLPGQIVDVVDTRTNLTVETYVLAVESDHLSGVRTITAGRTKIADFTTATSHGERKAEKKSNTIQSNEDWRWVQDRIRQEGVSTLPLSLNTSYCAMLKKSSGAYVWDKSVYMPRAIYSWSRKILNIIANFKMTAAVNAVSDNYITVLTGLPTIFSAMKLYGVFNVQKPDGTAFVLNGRYTTEHFTQIADEGSLPSSAANGECVYVKSTCEYWTRVSGEWVRRYTPCGVLQIVYVDFMQGSAFSLASGDIVTVSPQPISMATKYGAHVFPKVQAKDVQRVSAWIKANRGTYDYSNNGIWRRQLASEQTDGLGATDCSGMINQAFRYGAGLSVPDGTKVMCGYGKIVTFAKAGEELDTSLLHEGDICGWINPSTDGRIGACHHVAIVVRGTNDDANDNKLRLWHQTTSFGCYEHQKRDNEQKDDAVIPSFQSYIHTSLVTPTRTVGGVTEANDIVFGPQPCASQPYGSGQMSVYRATGNVYSDANYRDWEARIIVRWMDDADDLKKVVATVNEDDTGGEDDDDAGLGSE